MSQNVSLYVLTINDVTYVSACVKQNHLHMRILMSFKCFNSLSRKF